LRHEDGVNDKDAVEFLVKCRRLLVTEVQNAIDPRRRNAMLKRLAAGRKDDPESSFDVARTLGMTLNERYPDLPVVRAFLNGQRAFRGKS
jgi:hypothetical protein